MTSESERRSSGSSSTTSTVPRIAQPPFSGAVELADPGVGAPAGGLFYAGHRAGGSPDEGQGSPVLGGRESDSEAAALADLALDLDGAVVQMHEVLDDREAQPCAGAGLRPGAVHLIEALENLLALGPGNSGPAVRDRKPRPARLAERSQRHGRSLGRELDGVVEEVARDLAQTPTVGEGRRVLVAADLDLDAAQRGLRRQVPGGLAQQRG